MKVAQQFSQAIDRLHEEASAATGLTDFGDTAYREALSVLLKAYDDTADLGELGRYASYASLVNCLKGRLHTQAGITANPHCLTQTLKRPIFIVGLPRTGTTILHRLLAQDPSNQGLEYWLGSYPQPRPDYQDWASFDTYREVDQSLAMLGEINPEIKAIHEMTTEGIDECRLLLMHTFANVSFQANATVPDYEQWLYEADLSSAYAYYQRALKLIGSRDPHKRWVLKDPSHMWAMDTLLETFPDALIVQTHRDPLKLIPSVSSLVMSAKTMNEPHASPAVVGAQQLEQWAKVLEKTMAVRSRYPDRFVDIYFDEFMASPLQQVDKIYQLLGESINPSLRLHLEEWLQQHPQGQHGSHAYQASDFALSGEMIRERFATYQQQFNL